MDYYYLVKYIDTKGQRKQFFAKNFKGILHLCYIHKKHCEMNMAIPPIIYNKGKDGLINQLFGIVKYDTTTDKFIVIRKVKTNELQGING